MAGRATTLRSEISKRSPASYPRFTTRPFASGNIFIERLDASDTSSPGPYAILLWVMVESVHILDNSDRLSPKETPVRLYPNLVGYFDGIDSKRVPIASGTRFSIPLLAAPISIGVYCYHLRSATGI